MPVELEESLVIRTVNYKSWRIVSIHYDWLHTDEAVCTMGVELLDGDGNVVEKRPPIKTLVSDLAAKYPSLYDQIKQAHYAEAQALGKLASGSLT